MPTMKNVLIVCHAFPPVNIISARRFGLLAPHFESHGWCPWILTTQASGPQCVTIPEKQIIRIGRHSYSTNRCLSGQGSAASVVTPRIKGGRLRNCLLANGLYSAMIQPTLFTWYPQVRCETQEIIRRLPTINLVLGSYGPSSSLWLARHLANRLHAPWIADFRDLAALSSDHRNRGIRWLDRQLERRLLSTASAITTVSPTMLSILSAVYPLPAEVIYNGCDLDPEGIAIEQAGAESKFVSITIDSSAERVNQLPYLYYAGRFYPHRMAALWLMMECLQDHRQLHLRIRSLGPAEFDQEIGRHATEMGVASQVHLLPPCEPELADREAAQSVANLVFEDLSTVNQHTSGNITGKFLKMATFQPPIISIARPDSDLGPILNAIQRGRLCSTKPELMDCLDLALNHPECFTGNLAQLEQFSVRSQARALIKLFNQIAVPETQGPTVQTTKQTA